MSTMDPIETQQHSLSKHGGQDCSKPGDEISTAVQVVDENGQIGSHELIRELSKVRLAVILGGLWVGIYTVR